MPYSNYPNGFSQGVVIRGVPLAQSHPGKVFWVGSSTLQGVAGASNSNDGTFFRPFATIDYAVGQCAANRGDVIMVRPGHTETVAAAAGLALDVAGIAVIGLGRGANRPTVNLTATASTVTISAADVTVSNVLFTGGVDAIVAVIVISAADVALVNCEYRDVTGQATVGILTTAAANRLLIQNFRYDGAIVAGPGAGIAIVGGDGINIDGLDIDGDFSVGCIDIRTTATTDFSLKNARMRTRNAADILLVDTITGSTGFIGPNIQGRLADNAANITEAITGATFVYFQLIQVVNLAGETAFENAGGVAHINKVASTDI